MRSTAEKGPWKLVIQLELSTKMMEAMMVITTMMREPQKLKIRTLTTEADVYGDVYDDVYADDYDEYYDDDYYGDCDD